MCETSGTAVIAATARMENYPRFMRKLGRQQTENECGCSKGEKERESTSKQKDKGLAAAERPVQASNPDCPNWKHELYNTMAYWPPSA